VQVTSAGMLEQMKDPTARSAWEEFYRAYWAVIVHYAQKQGLDEAAAQDVLQETMVALLEILPRFTYDPSRGKFRNFLLTIVHRKALAARRRFMARRQVPYDEATHEGGLAPAEVLADEQSPRPSQVFEEQWRESIQVEALRRVRDDPAVRGRTWEVFKAYVIDRKRAGDVAKRFGIAENAVYQIKNRIVRRLREEVRHLTNHGVETARESR